MVNMIHSILHNNFAKAVKFHFRKFVGKESSFISLKDYSRKHPESITIVCQGKEATIYSENQINLAYENALREGGEVDTFVIMLKSAGCFAYSDVVLLDNGRYYSETRDNPIIGAASDCTDGYVLILDKKNYYKVNLPQRKHFIEKGILLSGLFSWNYYHFTFQIIPKLQRIERIDPSVPLLVDKKAEDIPSFACLLRICNDQNRSVFVLEENVHYSVGELYLVSMQTVLLPNYKIGVSPPAVECCYRPSVLRYLRNKVISHADRSMDYPKRVFLGRKNVASGRRPFNEEECIACAKEFGFEVVYPESMSFEQQVGLFNQAECVIGGSGAAFTNLIYCNNNVKVVVFSKYHVNFALWQTIVDFIGGKLCFIEENEGQIQPPELLHAPFHVDVEKLKTTLNEIS